MSYPPIETLPNNPKLSGLARMCPDIVYSTATGTELKLAILMPWENYYQPETAPRRPLIVFVQGSAWTFPDIYSEIPQLSDFARNGYVVATVTHRNAMEGHPFPAYLQDVKTAIRFLRKNAEKYGIDPEHVAIWGTSSGGNTAMLVGLTPDDPSFKTEEYAECSDAVNAVVQCFGPTDLYDMFDYYKESFPGQDFDAKDNVFYGLCGGPLSQHMEIGDKMSPIFYVDGCPKLPPFLMLQGDADPVVPYAQCVKMYEKLYDAGADVRMIRIEGAPHERSFWSRELLDIIAGYIAEKI